MEEKKVIKLEYYPFVIISSIIGAVLSYLFFHKVTNFSTIISIIFTILSVGIYISICLSLKKYLEKWVLSEIFLYLFFGFLTTVVNIISFNIINVAFKGVNFDIKFAWKAAELLAFIIAVLFAYITNKLFVFKSTSFSLPVLGKEIAGFFGARIITEAIAFIIMWVLIDKMNKAELLGKIIAALVTIILNYIASKFFVFKTPVIENTNQSEKINNAVQNETQKDTTNDSNSVNG